MNIILVYIMGGKLPILESFRPLLMWEVVFVKPWGDKNYVLLVS